MSPKSKLPKIPYLFFKWYCRRDRFEELHGDLEELFYEREAENGRLLARIQYIMDVIRCCQPYAWKKTHTMSRINLMLLRNYYFTAIRNLSRYKTYFSLNIAGLSIGITSIILITLFIITELSYDKFHRDNHLIYRVNAKGNINGKIQDQATSNMPLAKTLKQNYPEVLKSTRIKKAGTWFVGKGKEKFNETGILFADSNFFEVFNFSLLAGNPKTALLQPRSMVLTKSYAQKYFGHEDPIGQYISVGHDTLLYKVTGVLENVPSNTHIQFDMLGSLITYDHWNDDRWIGQRDNYTYVMLKPNTDLKSFEEKIQEIVPNYIGPEIEYYTGLSYQNWLNSGNQTGFYLKPIHKIYLNPSATDELGTSSSIMYIYLYGVVGVILLFIAIFNFINLATAQSAIRSKEIGVRKVIGSSKEGLVFQFLTESMVISTIATLFAVLMVVIMRPYFEMLIGKPLAYGITSSVYGPMLVTGLAILVGVLAGSYPAFKMSSFKTINVLKGNSKNGQGTMWLRNFLVVMQFSASILIIIGTIVIYSQIDFMMTNHLGFDKDRVLVIRRPNLLKTHLESFKNDLKQHSNIVATANATAIPGKNYHLQSFRREENVDVFLFLTNQVSFGYESLMGLELKAGRYFSTSYSTDSNAVVINEAAAKALGYVDPIGKNLLTPNGDGKGGQDALPIIGVVKDFQFASMHKHIEPMALKLLPKNKDGYVVIKINNDKNIRETLSFIEENWRRYTDMPIETFFFDKDYEHLYQSESTTGKIFLTIAVLSIFISCLGLVGLITFMANMRHKEIGIRKILGASIKSLILLLSNDIVRLVLIAIVISWPLGYFLSEHWLENFANQHHISWWYFVAATLIVTLIAAASISFQTIKAALIDPTKFIKDQ